MRQARKSRADLTIVARARDAAHARALYKLGANRRRAGNHGGEPAIVRGRAGRHRRADGPRHRLDPRAARHLSQDAHRRRKPGGAAAPVQGAAPEAAGQMTLLSRRRAALGLGAGLVGATFPIFGRARAAENWSGALEAEFTRLEAAINGQLGVTALDTATGDSQAIAAANAFRCAARSRRSPAPPCWLGSMQDAETSEPDNSSSPQRIWRRIRP